MLLLTWILWGPEAWLRWLSGVTQFHGYLQDHGIDREDKGIYGLALQLGLPGWLFLFGIPLGIACTWLVFNRQSKPVDRYAAFAVSTILLSPYTLGYDLAGLTVATMGLLLDEERKPVVWLAAALIVSSMLANFGVLLLAFLFVRERWPHRQPA